MEPKPSKPQNNSDKNLIQKNDFIEIDFSGRSNDKIFDTTKPEEAKEIGLDVKVKPVILSVGHGMVLPGLDKNLAGKEIGREYTIKISSEDGFGPRKPELIKTVPMKVFREKNLNPFPGLTLQLDNYIAKVLSVSGGRVIMDFNNPMAGKELDYQVKILRKIDNINEKVEAICKFFLKRRHDFEVKENKVIFKEPALKPFLEIFNQRFKEMTGYDFEVQEKEKKEDEEKKPEDKNAEEKNIS